MLRCHEDFRDGLNPPNSGIASTTPNFTIVKRGVLRTALVLDVSGSMTGRRIQRVHQVSYILKLHRRSFLHFMYYMEFKKIVILRRYSYLISINVYTSATRMQVT